ncbi:hypothetical protein [Pseudoxanthomonas sp. UTMC 1351]|uniref:hypothetical protein n=1 Tax=Pseudoxanthomonas sp. UTMC 1351 TaxID=2695853 RepID=UPI0034D01CD3
MATAVNRVITAFGFLTIGLLAGGGLSSLPALDIRPAGALSDETANLSNHAYGPDHPLDQSQALGVMLSMSAHERLLAEDAAQRASPLLAALARRHAQQYRHEFDGALELNPDPDSPLSYDLWTAADSERMLLLSLSPTRYDLAYLEAALKCQRKALGVIDLKVRPALVDEASQAYVAQVRANVDARLTDLVAIHATLSQEATPEPQQGSGS